MGNVAEAMGGLLLDDDVPSSLRTGGKLAPLGRYLRGKLREEYGMDSKTPDGWALRASEELRLMSEKYYDSSRYEATGKHFRDVENEKRKQKALNKETKAKLFSIKGGI